MGKKTVNKEEVENEEVENEEVENEEVDEDEEMYDSDMADTLAEDKSLTKVDKVKFELENIRTILAIEDIQIHPVLFTHNLTFTPSRKILVEKHKFDQKEVMKLSDEEIRLAFIFKLF